MKRCSSSLMIRQTQIKTMSYPKAPVIKESIYDKYHEGLQKRKLHCWWECTLVTCTMENSMEVSVKSLSRARLFRTPWTAAHQVPLCMRFSRQGYWTGLPSPGDLPDPGIEPRFSAMQADSLPTELQGKFCQNMVCMEVPLKRKVESYHEIQQSLSWVGVYRRKPSFQKIPATQGCCSTICSHAWAIVNFGNALVPCYTFTEARFLFLLQDTQKDCISTASLAVRSEQMELGSE